MASRKAVLVLDLRLDAADGVATTDNQRIRLAHKSLDKDLHFAIHQAYTDMQTASCEKDDAAAN